MFDRIKKETEDFLEPLCQFFLKHNITPNSITYLSFIIALAASALVIKGMLFIACWVYLFAGALDMIDGQVARRTKSSKKGAFLDSTFDRFSETAAAIAFIFYFQHHPHPILNMAPIILLFIATSLLTSYMRARAEGLGFDCKVGIMQRPERVVLTCFGLVFGGNVLGWIILVIAVAGLFSVIQRFFHTIRLIGG